jgi:integrase
MASVAKRRWIKPDGSTGERWQVRYIDPATGKRPGKMFELKKDADAFRKKIEREIEDGMHTADGSSKTIAVVADEFIRHYNQRERDGTVGKTYLIAITATCKNYIVPNLGGVKISHLTFENVERLRDALVKKRLAPVSVKNMMGVLKLIEGFARRRGYTKKSMVRDVMSEAPAGRAKVVAVPSMSEARHIMQTALSPARGHTARSDAMMGLIVTAATVCGLRYGEIMGLRLVDLDFDDDILQVRQSVTRLGQIKGPKTSAGLRDIPMPQKLSGLFKDWIAEFYVDNPHQLVITTVKGNTVKGSSFAEDYWAPLLKRAGMPYRGGERFHFHALRHFAASMMIAHNMPLTDVASLMGHAKFDMTLQVYAHPLIGGSRRADVIERMALMHNTQNADALVTHSIVNA